MKTLLHYREELGQRIFNRLIGKDLGIGDPGQSLDFCGSTVFDDVEEHDLYDESGIDAGTASALSFIIVPPNHDWQFELIEEKWDNCLLDPHPTTVFCTKLRGDKETFDSWLVQFKLINNLPQTEE